MFRRYYQNDELLSSVILSFTALLICGLLVSLKLVGVDDFDAEMIVYISLGSISFIVSLITLILFLIGNKKPFIDIEIDFEQEELRVFNRLKTYSFQDVKLISYNTRHHQIRLFVKHRLLGFTLESIKDKDEKPLTLDQAMKIGSYGYVVQPKKLYNYHLLSSLLFTGLFVFYAFFVAYQEFLWFGRWYIHSYYILSVTVVFIGLVVFINQWRIRKIYREQMLTETSTSED